MKRLITYQAIGLVTLILAFVGSFQTRSQTAAMGMEVAGQFGGASYAVAFRQAQDGAARPPYLYLGVGPRLVILDVAQAEQPAPVGQSEILPGVVRSLALSEGLAFVAAGLGGLQVVDVSDPARPFVLASYETGGYLEDLAVAGSVLYLASTPKWDGSNWVGAGLQAVDVTDPRQPLLLGGYDTPGYEHGVAAADGWVFVADGDGGLRVLDATNPATLKEVGFYDTPGYALDVATDGEYAYVADFTEGLRVVDVGDPAEPKEVGFVETPGKARGVTLAGQTVYVAAGEGGLRVVDVVQPPQLKEGGMFAPESDVRGAAVLSTTGADGLAYVADRKRGLRVVRIGEEGAMQEVGSYDTLGYVSGVAVAETVESSYAYVASGGDLRVLDINTIEAPRMVGSHPVAGEANDLAVTPDQRSGQDKTAFQLFLAEGPVFQHRQWVGGGLRVLGMQEGRVSEEIAFLDSPGQASGVDLKANQVYLADGSAGVHVYEIGNPAEPKEVAAQDMASEVRDIVLGKDRIHVAVFGRGVGAGVASAPDVIAIDRRYEDALFARGLAWADGRSNEGDRLYVVGGFDGADPLLTGHRGAGDGLHILTAGNPDSMREVGFVATPGDIRNLAVLSAGERNKVRLVVADGDGGLLFLQEAAP